MATHHNNQIVASKIIPQKEKRYCVQAGILQTKPKMMTTTVKKI